MEDTSILRVQVNPIAFIKVDEPWASLDKKPITSDDLLEYLCDSTIENDLESIIKRYKEISVENPRINCVPDEEKILEKLVWPLKHAKASYSLGNYLGAIALCGIVSEMVAIMIFDINSFSINESIMDKKAQIALFGSEFEKLGQERRIEILKIYKLISEDIVKMYIEIKNIRRKYLHFWSKPVDGIKKDSIICFTNTVKIVIDGLGLSIESGILSIKKELIEKLKSEKV